MVFAFSEKSSFLSHKPAELFLLSSNVVLKEKKNLPQSSTIFINAFIIACQSCI